MVETSLLPFFQTLLPMVSNDLRELVMDRHGSRKEQRQLERREETVVVCLLRITRLLVARGHFSSLESNISYGGQIGASCTAE